MQVYVLKLGVFGVAALAAFLMLCDAVYQLGSCSPFFGNVSLQVDFLNLSN